MSWIFWLADKQSKVLTVLGIMSKVTPSTIVCTVPQDQVSSSFPSSVYPPGSSFPTWNAKSLECRGRHCQAVPHTDGKQKKTRPWLESQNRLSSRAGEKMLVHQTSRCECQTAVTWTMSSQTDWRWAANVRKTMGQERTKYLRLFINLHFLTVILPFLFHWRHSVHSLGTQCPDVQSWHTFVWDAKYGTILFTVTCPSVYTQPKLNPGCIYTG